MRTLLKRILLLLVIVLPIIALLFYIDSRQNNETETLEISEDKKADFTENTFIEKEIPKTIETIIEEEEILNLKQSAWIPPWDYKNSLQSLERFETQYHSVSPVAFQVNKDGSLSQRLDPNLNDLKDILQRKNIKLVPTISNFDWTVMKSIFDNEQNTKRHIDSIVKVTKDYNYDGIDLDYESLKLENKQHFLSFLEELSKKLASEDKILSVTVLPKWGEGVVYTSFRETREVQDWEVLAKWADEIRIMAYDFTPISSSTEGPIAPIGWVERILDYAKNKIPKEKTWLGIHLYSYEWVMPTKDSEEMKVKTNSYTYNTVKNKILIHDYVDVKYDENYEEGYAEYKCMDTHVCLLYYATPRTVKARKILAEKYDIAGIAYWRLGGEDDLIK